MTMNSIKEWFLGLLDPPQEKFTITFTKQRSGAVRFHVADYMNTEAGREQLNEASDLAKKLNLKEV